MNVYDLANNLAKGLKNSSQTKNYQEALGRIKSDPEKQKILTDFRMKQMEVQAMQMMGQEISPEKMEELEKFSEILNFHLVIREFLQAEYYLGQVLGDVQKIIGEAVEVWNPEGLEELLKKQ